MGAGRRRQRGVERVRLKDVLDRANLRPETVEIVVNGADEPVLDGTPDFIKSIPIDKALDHERRAATALQRLSDPADRARLDRHIPDEAPR